MVSALDRFGMAQALVDAGADVLFGDFIFALDKDMPVRDLASSKNSPKNISDACKLPFQFFYPTGKKQEKASRSLNIHTITKRQRSWPATFISCVKFIPDRLEGKIDSVDQHRDPRRR